MRDAEANRVLDQAEPDNPRLGAHPTVALAAVDAEMERRTRR